MAAINVTFDEGEFQELTYALERRIEWLREVAKQKEDEKVVKRRQEWLEQAESALAKLRAARWVI